MINDFLTLPLELLSQLLTTIGLVQLLADLLVKLNTVFNYTEEIHYYLSGAYFIFGRPLLGFVLTSSGIVFVVKFVMAIVMIVSQFIP